MLGTEPFRLGKPSHLPFAGKEFFNSRNLICHGIMLKHYERRLHPKQGGFLLLFSRVIALHSGAIGFFVA